MNYLKFTIVISLILFTGKKQEAAAQMFSLNAADYSYDSSGCTDSVDFSFIDKYVKDKQILFLGEDSHWVSEFNVVKGNLISYLHKKFGFSIILMESKDPTTFWRTIVDTSNILNQFYGNHAIIWAWLNEENKRLFCQARSKPDSIIIGGMDIVPLFWKRNDTNLSTANSRKYTSESQYLPASSKARMLVLDSVARHLFEIGSNQSINGSTKEERRSEYKDKEKLSQLIADLNNLKADYIKELSLLPPPQTIDEKLLYRILLARPTLMRSVIELNCFGKLRDSIMAENITYFADSLFSNERIIVWAHDGHISKSSVNHEWYPTSIGMFLPESIKAKSYFLAVKHSEWAYNKEYIYKKSSANHKESIENDLEKIGNKAFFLDIREAQNAGLLRKQYKYSYVHLIYQSSFHMKYKPEDQYDGIIYIKSTSMPHYSIPELKEFYNKGLCLI